jgi:hypothetical protein
MNQTTRSEQNCSICEADSPFQDCVAIIDFLLDDHATSFRFFIPEAG